MCWSCVPAVIKEFVACILILSLYDQSASIFVCIYMCIFIFMIKILWHCRKNSIVFYYIYVRNSVALTEAFQENTLTEFITAAWKAGFSVSTGLTMYAFCKRDMKFVLILKQSVHIIKQNNCFRFHFPPKGVTQS